MNFPPIMDDVLTIAGRGFRKRFVLNGHLYVTGSAMLVRCSAEGEQDTAGDFASIANTFDWLCPSTLPAPLPIVGVGLEVCPKCGGRLDKYCDYCAGGGLFSDLEGIEISPPLRLAKWAVGLLRANGVYEVYPREMKLHAPGVPMNYAPGAYFKTEHFDGYVAGICERKGGAA